jgi:2-ketoarginine methyltransferase
MNAISDDVDVEFGDALRRSLRHIEGHVVSAVMLHALREGVIDALTTHATVSAAAAERGWNEGVVTAVAEFLVDTGILLRADGGFALTAFGRLLRRQGGWFRLLIGGYGGTFADLSTILKKGPQASHRDELEIAIGSGDVDRYDTLPVALRILEQHAELPRRMIVDLGAGSGVLLAELCARLPESRGIGVVLGADCADIARQTLASAGLGERASVVQENIWKYSPPPDTDLFVCAFVLQEMAFQRGVDAVMGYMRQLRESCAEASWLVFEVPERGAGRGDQGSYYNCYRLIHHLTKQSLLADMAWKEIFARAGYVVVECAQPTKNVDPSGCEVCYLLRPA